MAKTASITTSLTSASLYTNNRSRRTLFLVGSHSTYVKKLSSVWTFEFSGLVQLFSMMAPFASKKLKCPLSMTLCDWSRDFPLFLITSSTIVIILAQWSITHWVKLTEGIDSLKNGIAVSVQVVMTLSQVPWPGPHQLHQVWLPKYAFTLEERCGGNSPCQLSNACSMSCMLRSGSAFPQAVSKDG